MRGSRKVKRFVKNHSEERKEGKHERNEVKGRVIQGHMVNRTYKTHIEQHGWNKGKFSFIFYSMDDI